MATKKFFIVWAPNKLEAFVTDSEHDAGAVSTGFHGGSVSAAGDAFREAYADEDADLGDTVLECEEIELEV